jgi:hypothetical protein
MITDREKASRSSKNPPKTIGRDSKTSCLCFLFVRNKERKSRKSIR